MPSTRMPVTTCIAAPWGSLAYQDRLLVSASFRERRLQKPKVELNKEKYTTKTSDFHSYVHTHVHIPACTHKHANTCMCVHYTQIHKIN